MTGKLYLKPWYLLLLPLFFVWHGYVDNFGLIPPKELLTQLLIYLGSAGVLFFFCWLIFKNFARAAFFSFLLMAFNFFFGFFHDGLKSFFSNAFIHKYSVLAGAGLVFFLAIGIYINKKKLQLRKTSLYLNLLFCILIIFDLPVFIKKSTFSSRWNARPELKDLSICGKRELPDIYLIVADDYAGKKELADILHYDNTDFYDSLKARGFFVANNSRSNYNHTTYSIGSLLNMAYLPLKPKQVRRADHSYALALTLDNKVTSFLSDAGYEIHNYSPLAIKNEVARNRYSFIPPRISIITSQTFLNRLNKEVLENLDSRFLKNKAFKWFRYNQYVYEQSMRVVKENRPGRKFVYTHLELPHYPYYYDKNGKLYPFEKILNELPCNSISYLEYLKYTNGMLLKFVDEIIRNNRTPPIIILMSDHGHRCLPDSISSSYIFLNLLSVNIPDKNYLFFNDSLSNVNVFRSIFNTAFCQQLPMLKDSTIETFEY